MNIARNFLIAYLAIGIMIISIGSNIERGCNDAHRSSFITCVGFVLIWPAFAVLMSTIKKDFPCEGMNK